MIVYDLERTHRHTFYYVEEATSFDYRNGDELSDVTVVRCLGCAFEGQSSMLKDEIRNIKDMGVAPCNDWNFIVRDFWLSAVSRDAFFSYNGKVYEIVNYTTLEGGWHIEARDVRRTFEVIEETAVVSLSLDGTLS